MFVTARSAAFVVAGERTDKNSVNPTKTQCNRTKNQSDAQKLSASVLAADQTDIISVLLFSPDNWRTKFQCISSPGTATASPRDADREINKWVVFAGSASALVLAAGIGVLVGAQLERFIKPQTLKLVAGAGFIAIGVWTMLSR